MKTFRDATGREWAVVIDVGAMKRVRGLTGVNLYSLIDDGFRGLGELLGDVITFVDVLYALCKPEADSRNVSDEDFGRLMRGDVIEAATSAFLDEYADFFPDPRVRTALGKVIDAGRTMGERAKARMDAELDELLAKASAETPNGSSNGAPESSASTPALAPCESSP
jgi:hypothetical protein